MTRAEYHQLRRTAHAVASERPDQYASAWAVREWERRCDRAYFAVPRPSCERERDFNLRQAARRRRVLERIADRKRRESARAFVDRLFPHAAARRNREAA